MMYNKEKLEPQKKIIADILGILENYDDVFDIIIDYSAKNNLEIDYVASIVEKNPVIYSKIEEAAENLNFLPKKKRLE